MSMLVVLAAEEHNLAPLIMPIYFFAIIPAAIALLLGLVTWSFRDVSNRHTHRVRPGVRTEEPAGH